VSPRRSPNYAHDVSALRPNHGMPERLILFLEDLAAGKYVHCRQLKGQRRKGHTARHCSGSNVTPRAAAPVLRPGTGAGGVRWLY
jgi:hypothetical protein